MARLPVDDALDRLAAPFHDAERRIRELVARAPDGDRRALLIEAIAILVELRRDAADAGQYVEHAYLVAARAVDVLLGAEGSRTPSARAVRDLAGSLPAQLDRAVKRAQEGSRRAFHTVTGANVDDAAQEAVTALVDRAGARQPLGAHAALLTATLGRHAVSRGTRDALPDDGLVTISAHGTKNPICAPIEGQTYPASGPLPPFHANCQHVATPSGFTIGEHAAAMREAADS